MNDKMVLTEKEVMRALDNAKARLKEAEKEVRKYAKKDPSKAIMIAAGAGAAIGAILMLAAGEEVKKGEGRKKERPWEKRLRAREKRAKAKSRK